MQPLIALPALAFNRTVPNYRCLRTNLAKGTMKQTQPAKQAQLSPQQQHQLLQHQPPVSQQVSDDYKLLLTPPFSTMTKITDNLFLTGVGGMTRSNFAKNHIDFVVNITTDAPFWRDTESMRLALEDDVQANMLPHFDFAVDKIHEAITKRNAHVLVHCVAGVSRSATIVIAYLMKFRRLDLKCAFNYCYNLRPCIRPNNGFMLQLINYERQLFGRPSAVQIVEADVDGTLISVPNFFLEEHPRLVLLEVLRTRDLLRLQSQTSAINQLQVNQMQPQQQPQLQPPTSQLAQTSSQLQPRLSPKQPNPHPPHRHSQSGKGLPIRSEAGTTSTRSKSAKSQSGKPGSSVPSVRTDKSTPSAKSRDGS